MLFPEKRKRKPRQRKRKPAAPAMMVPAVIDRALAKLPRPAYLQSLAPIIGCAYQNLWSVYRGKRPLPALKVRSLCNFVGLSADECFEVLAAQERDWQRLKDERTPADAEPAAELEHSKEP